MTTDYNAFGAAFLPGLLGIVFHEVSRGRVSAELPARQEVMAPNGFLHAATVVALADTACGYGCRKNLPPEANGFTTIELKTNHLGTARDGTIECVATPVHVGRTTQVWDAARRARRSRCFAARRWCCTRSSLRPSPLPRPAPPPAPARSARP